MSKKIKKFFFQHYVKIEDNEDGSINADGYKFKENSRAYDLKKWEVEKIQNIVLHKVKQSKDTLEKK